eukprot:1148215-Prymnesium_polylepis.1
MNNRHRAHGRRGALRGALRALLDALDDALDERRSRRYSRPRPKLPSLDRRQPLRAELHLELVLRVDALDLR